MQSSSSRARASSQAPDYNDFEMITSPKVLLPSRGDGTLVSSGPQLRGSGDAALPESVVENTDDNHNRKLIPQPLPPQPAYSNGGTLQHTGDQLEWEVPAKAIDSDRNSDGRDPKKGRRWWCCCSSCCGFYSRLSRRARWIVGVSAALVILGILAGGIAGGLARRSLNQNYRSSSYYDPDSGRNPYRSSDEARRLAALNWTSAGAGNETRHAVFYQLEGALFLQQYRPGNETWAPHNISADFGRRDLNVPVVKAGTPLAAAATPAERGADAPFEAALFYMNADNEIRQLVSRDADLLSWAYEDGHPSRSAANWTQLAAAADFCGDGSCRDAFCYAYQNRDQNVMLACGDDWDEPVQLDGAHPGGAFALIPSAREQDGGGDNATTARELLLFHYTDTAVKLFHVFGNSSWDAEEKPILSSLYSSNNNNAWSSSYDEPPRVVATPLNRGGGGGAYDVFAMAVTGAYAPEAKGSLYSGSSSSSGGEWAARDRTVEVDGALGNGSGNGSRAAAAGGVALDHAGFFYAAAFSEWTIFQYAWSADEPFALAQVGEISIWEDCLGTHSGCGE